MSCHIVINECRMKLSRKTEGVIEANIFVLNRVVVLKHTFLHGKCNLQIDVSTQMKYPCSNIHRLLHCDEFSGQMLCVFAIYCDLLKKHNTIKRLKL